LCARILGQGEVYLTDVEASIFGARWNVEYVPILGRYAFQGITYPKLGFPHFPYGWNVEPDKPV